MIRLFAVSAVALLAVPREPAADPDSLEVRRREIASVVAAAPARLHKLELRPTMKTIYPSLLLCYERARVGAPRIQGVINTKLTIRNDPQRGLTLTVNGFETDGPLGSSADFLACVKQRFEGKVFAPIATRGSLDVTYPGTFTTEPLDNRDKPIVDRANRNAKAARWGDALADAAQGLKLTSLDGPLRRRLIEIGGLAACHLSNEPQARRYYSLASPELETELEQACAASKIDLAK